MTDSVAKWRFNLRLSTITIFVVYGFSRAQKNLSPFGIPTQSSTFFENVYHNASLAITGGPTNDYWNGSCSHTGENQSAAWWMLALPNDTLFIEQVNIFYRERKKQNCLDEDCINPTRLDGYYLYLSNTSISGLGKQTPPGDLCYHDTVDGTALINQSVSCNQLAKYVILYNDHIINENESPFLELCDVQVIGCSKQRYGLECRNACSSTCFGQHCFPSNGSCVWGCNCLGDHCDGNETCTVGCKEGFFGQYCNNAFMVGFPYTL